MRRFPKKLGEHLLSAKLLTPEQVVEGLEDQKQYGGRLGTNLMELGFLNEEQLARSLGELHGIPYAHGEMVPDAAALAVMPSEFYAVHDILPMRIGATKLVVAVVDPTKLAAFDTLAFKTGKTIVKVIVTEFRMNLLLRKYFNIARPMRSLDFGQRRKSRADGGPPESVELMAEEEFARLYGHILDAPRPTIEPQFPVAVTPVPWADAPATRVARPETSKTPQPLKPAEPPPPPTQARVGRYELLNKLATGGMAEVWLARLIGVEGFQKYVVVKRILSHLSGDPEFVEMFLNEARIAAKLSHPNIGQIFELGQLEDQYFLAMEFIHGEDLGRVARAARKRGTPLEPGVALRIVALACEGLHYAHNAMDEGGKPLQLVHRDISPQNILVSFDGGVKIVDFGIAKAASMGGTTRTGTLKGKLSYMAPELVAGRTIDKRVDIFALGLVLYELVTGERPLKRESEVLSLQAALRCEIPLPSEVAQVPTDLEGVIMRAVAKDPNDRYPDARDFQLAIEQYLMANSLLVTSAQVSTLMRSLFGERLKVEQQLGSPQPETASHVSN